MTDLPTPPDGDDPLVQHGKPPFGERLVGNRNGSDENRRAINLPDKELVRVSFDAVEHAIPKFDFGWRAHKHLHVQQLPHNAEPPRRNTERFGNRPADNNNVKQHFGLIVPLLPTVANLRLVVAANDTGWHPLDAA